jgi:hypothetical protein
MVHGALAHKDMRVMREFRTMFAENGFNTLAVNLSLGLDRRSSEMYDCAQPSIHMAEDALDEIGAWLDWLAEQGCTARDRAGAFAWRISGRVVCGRS